jgi:hypothetical protein
MESFGQTNADSQRLLFERIKSDAVRRTSFTNAKPSNLYILEEVLPQGTVIQPKREEIFLERETIMVFADDAPGFNWTHPCHYLLYQDDQPEARKIPAQLPPFLTETPETYHKFHEQVPTPKVKTTWPAQSPVNVPAIVSQANRYAVLFSGSSNNRHVNDLEFLYRTLIDVYRYPEENVYVLNYDGTFNYSGGPKPGGNWPGDNTAYRMKVKAAGTKSELEDVLDDLKSRLELDDSLLIHTNNHGLHDGMESVLITYSPPDYSAGELASKLAELPQFGHLTVMMEQCHAGGFNAPILSSSPAKSTTVASACEELQSSIGGADFDPFARDWVAAMNGSDPHGASLVFDPDVHGKGGVSVHEAYNYAEAVKDPYDTPVYSESSVTAGDSYLG